MKVLERRLELPSVVAISISAMLGSGVFVLPGLAFAKAGGAVWLAYLCAAVCVLPAALSKAELATAMPTSGGTYVYLERVFGPLVGTVAGLGLTMSLLLKASFALVGFSAYLHVLADVPIRPTALALLGIIVLLNMRGAKRVSQVQSVVVTVAVLGLALLIADGIASFDPAEAPSFLPDDAGMFLATTALVFVSYAGVTKVAAIAEEIKNPSRNLPLGFLISLGTVAVIYAGATFIMAAVVPLEELAGDLHPIYTLGQHLGRGPWLGIATAVLGIVTMTSMANAGLLAASRFPFAMSRERLLPPFLAALDSRFLTPARAILSCGVVMAVVIAVVDIEGIAKLASVFKIVIFAMVCLSVIVLREADVGWYKPEYRSPLYPWVQVFGIVAGLVLAFQMGWFGLVGCIAVIVPGVLLYFGYGRRRTDRRGVVAQRGRRIDLLRQRDTIHALPDADISGEAAVVVSLYGLERSPETLVEIGEALCDGGKLEVVHLTELPEQTVIDAVEDQDPRINSVRRRILAMAESRRIPVEFESIATRDLIETVHEISARLHCRWLLLELGERQHSFTHRDPLGWLTHHLSANLAIFSDAGIRTIRKIMVYAEPGPHDALVIEAADQLAEFYGGDLTFVRCMDPEAPLTAAQAEADYLDEISALSRAKSATLLLRGDDPISALADASAGYDLLVTGGRPQGNFLSRLRGIPSDPLAERAACSVLRLLTPRHQTHAAVERYRARQSPKTEAVLEVFEPACVVTKLTARNKQQLFESFAREFAKVLPDVAAGRIVEALWERERKQNTSVGHGLALPHATVAEATGTHLGVFTTEEPVAYQAPDGQAVDVFFVTIGSPSDRQTHLVLLARVAKMVLGGELLANLRAANDREGILRALREAAAEDSLLGAQEH